MDFTKKLFEPFTRAKVLLVNEQRPSCIYGQLNSLHVTEMGYRSELDLNFSWLAIRLHTATQIYWRMLPSQDKRISVASQHCLTEQTQAGLVINRLMYGDVIYLKAESETPSPAPFYL